MTLALLLTRTFLVIALGCGATTGCGTRPKERAHDPFHEASTRPVSRSGEAENMGGADYRVRTILRRVGDPRPSLAMPTLLVQSSRPASVSVGSTLSFVETFATKAMRGGWLADPVIGTIEDGLRIDVVVDQLDVPGDKADLMPDPWKLALEQARLAYRIRLSGVRRPVVQGTVRFHPDGVAGTIELPEVDEVEAAGCRRVRLNRLVHVARLPDPGGNGEFDVLVRVEPGPALMDALPDEAPESTLDSDEETAKVILDLLDGWQACTLDVSLRAVILTADLDPGLELDVGSSDSYLEGSRTLRRFRIATTTGKGSIIRSQRRRRVVSDYRPGARHEDRGAEGAAVPDAYEPVLSDLVTGFEARVEKGTVLCLRWTTAPAATPVETRLPNGVRVRIDGTRAKTHEARLRLITRRRLVPMAAIEGGGTLAVVVEISAP